VTALCQQEFVFSKKSYFMTAFKRWLWIPAFFLLVLIVFSFMPLPKANSGNCEIVTAIIERVEKGSGEDDIVLKLAGDDAYYYINRGIKYHDSMSQLINKCAEVSYIAHWSLLNINGKTRHVARVKAGDQVLYTEFEDD
jgi:hypothetical protein